MRRCKSGVVSPLALPPTPPLGLSRRLEAEISPPPGHSTPDSMDLAVQRTVATISRLPLTPVAATRPMGAP